MAAAARHRTRARLRTPGGHQVIRAVVEPHQTAGVAEAALHLAGEVAVAEGVWRRAWTRGYSAGSPTSATT